MQMRNLVREKIEKQGYALGAFVASSSPMHCEILAMNGIDFMVLDCEHAQTDAEQRLSLSCFFSDQLIEACFFQPIRRVSESSDSGKDQSVCRSDDGGIR